MFQSLKRFFLPVYKNKVASLQLVIESSVGTIWFDILPLFIIPFAIQLIQDKNYDKLTWYSLIIFGVYIVFWTAGVFLRKWDYQAKYKYEAWVEGTFRKKLILKDNLAMDVLGTGKVQSLIQKGIFSWIDGVWQILYQVPKVLLTLITGVFLMKDFGPAFLTLFFLYAIISGFGFAYYRNVKLKYDKRSNKIEDSKNAHSVRVIMSRQEIILSGKEKEESRELAAYADKEYRIVKHSAKYDFISDWFISGIGSLLPFLGALYIVNTDLKNSIDTTLFVAFIYFSSRFVFNMYSMLWIVRITMEHWPKIQNFWDLLDQVPELKNYETGKTFVHGRGDVEFKNVTFEYSQEFSKINLLKDDKEEVTDEKDESGDGEIKITGKPLLENFNLKIAGGSKLALVGLSGSGKTTVAKLIVGFLKASSGKVLVDGQDLSEISLKSFYKYIGFLTQEPSVFDGTIKENLLYAKKASDEEIKIALQKAECEFVFKMKKGINTSVGEKGIRLSGGERQRLAIAKLFLKNPEIIILDEPTAALDSFSEDTISRSLEELFKGRTVIIIAHRLQTVKNADRILVLEYGKVVEDGNHETLVNKGGVYAQMLAMQSGF
jgi:ABC-type multidrug transport system fused ATPase/permease subunit